MPPKATQNEEIKLVHRKDNLEDDERFPLEVARERIQSLEENIERRYLKPPLCKT